MKLLVLSDIHGNWPALQAVQEEADAIVCLGDIVAYGPFPRECVAWVRERAAHVVRGNHDTALAYRVDPRAAGFKRELAHHWRDLPRDDVTWLRGLPTEVHFRFDGAAFAPCTPHPPIISSAIA